jgi:ectoine hydroxylase-related dioxygenase (phytanoyl-CoA dioxygenase family)
MLSNAQVEQFRRDGFLKGARVLSDDEIAALQAETLRVIDQREDASVKQPVMVHNFTGDPERAVWQIVNIWEASEPFRRLISNPTIAEEVAQLTDAETVRLWHDQIQYKPASKGGVNHWHQDSPYWPTVEPKDQQVTAWVALDDVAEENGCMRMVPGSHRWGNHIGFLEAIPSYDEMPSEFEGHEVRVASCPVRRGEVHYHHALTWHGSGANLSGRPRRAIALHYMTEQTRFHAAGEHPMKPFIEIADGDMISGDHFPVVWRR